MESKTGTEHLDRRRCSGCGAYVSKDRFASSKWPGNVWPLCKRCEPLPFRYHIEDERKRPKRNPLKVDLSGDLEP